MGSKLVTYLRQSGSTLLMLLTFVVYVGNITLFTHRHTIDGQTIYHSHLYSGTDEQPNHSHSSQQVKTLAALAMYVALAAAAEQHIAAPVQRAVTILGCDIRNILRRSVHHFSLRAPPSIM